MDSRKETTTSGIMAIFLDFTIIFKCKNSLAPLYYEIAKKKVRLKKKHLRHL